MGVVQMDQMPKHGGNLCNVYEDLTLLNFVFTTFRQQPKQQPCPFLCIPGWKTDFYHQQNLRIFHNKRHLLSTNFHYENVYETVKYQCNIEAKNVNISFYFS